MGDLVAYCGSEGPEVDVVWEVGVEVWELKDSSWENYLVCVCIVVGVDFVGSVWGRLVDDDHVSRVF